jgi:hypothetical protein
MPVPTAQPPDGATPQRPDGATRVAGTVPDLVRRLLDEAVATLTRAAHLAWARPGPDGRPLTTRCDWAEFVTLAVAGAAANIGSTDEALAGRPGSWEAALVRDLLAAAVGPHDEQLHQHRTEPVVVDIDVDAVLTEQGAWLPYLAAQDELARRHDQAGNAPTGPDNHGTDGGPPGRVDHDLQRLQDRLERLREADWAGYGQALEASVRAAAAAVLPGLAVPVLVNVHLDQARPAAAPPAAGDRIWTLADELLTHAIATTALPTETWPAPLERLHDPGGPPAGAAAPLPRPAGAAAPPPRPAGAAAPPPPATRPPTARHLGSPGPAEPPGQPPTARRLGSIERPDPPDRPDGSARPGLAW